MTDWMAIYDRLRKLLKGGVSALSNPALWTAEIEAPKDQRRHLQLTEVQISERGGKWVCLDPADGTTTVLETRHTLGNAKRAAVYVNGVFDTNAAAVIAGKVVWFSVKWHVTIRPVGLKGLRYRFNIK